MFHEQGMYASDSCCYRGSPKTCRSALAASNIGRILRVQPLVWWNEQLAPFLERLRSGPFDGD
jgi:hypothetical protein